jgi:hypothetical protein
MNFHLIPKPHWQIGKLALVHWHWQIGTLAHWHWHWHWHIGTPLSHQLTYPKPVKSTIQQFNNSSNQSFGCAKEQNQQINKSLNQQFNNFTSING